MKKYLVLGLGLLFAAAIGLFIFYVGADNISVLNPRGEIAAKQRDLIRLSTLLMLVVVLPVFFMTFFIAWRYRSSNKKARYHPDWAGNRLIEAFWWAVPSVIIFALAIITWRSTHELDPFLPLESEKKPLTVQVVALQWKWLFIYPEQSVASLNQVNFPEDTPINFVITADAPMNSFWIPQLGGQIYAMAGMSTNLHLIASEPGTFRGSSANISGRGFADMSFSAVASDRQSFDKWVESARSSTVLNSGEYARLVEPGTYDRSVVYRLEDKALYDRVIAKYMSPGGKMNSHGR